MPHRRIGNLSPEYIRLDAGEPSQDDPASSYEVISQEEAHEKRHGGAITLYAAMLYDDPLAQPTQEDREPQPTERPGASGQGVSRWMEGHPEEAFSEQLQRKSGQSADPHEAKFQSPG